MGLLSLSPFDLKEVLPSYVDDLEEDVVSTFDSAFLVLPKLLRKYRLPYETIIEILEVNTMLHIALMEEGGATATYFEKSPIWQEIRNKAKNVVLALDKIEVR